MLRFGGKMDNVAATDADILVSANPGCHLQLDWGAREGKMKQKVLHIMELFGQAVPD